MNNVLLIGRLVKPVEVKDTVCKGSIAINGGKDKDGKDIVDYIDFKAFDKIAKVLVDYTTKGSQISIQGRIKVETWNDSSNALKRRVVVYADRVVLLDPKTKEATTEEAPF